MTKVIQLAAQANVSPLIYRCQSGQCMATTSIDISSLEREALEILQQLLNQPLQDPCKSFGGLVKVRPIPARTVAASTDNRATVTRSIQP